jgi:hypothetical protein
LLQETRGIVFASSIIVIRLELLAGTPKMRLRVRGMILQRGGLVMFPLPNTVLLLLIQATTSAADLLAHVLPSGTIAAPIFERTHSNRHRG